MLDELMETREKSRCNCRGVGQENAGTLMSR